MIGIIPGGSQTYVVDSYFNETTPIEDHLYADPLDGRIYVYSSTITRSTIDTIFLPRWDGKRKYVYKHSNEKYIDKDVIKTDINVLSNNIDDNIADNISYMQRKADNKKLLIPTIKENDNAFTQCIKAVFNKKILTLPDLVHMSNINEDTLLKYYTALDKISFMRADKWRIWIDDVFHLHYIISVYQNDKKLISYYHPENKYDTGIVKYDLIKSLPDNDFLKKITKITFIAANISKDDLKSDHIDDHTINNLMIVLNTNKLLSAQLFSRFIHMANLSFTIQLFENGELIFEYKE